MFPIHLPPLRERRDDIPLLMNHFLNHYRHKHACTAGGFTQPAVRALLNYSFPGNIRELQNLIERAVIMAEADGLIGVHHLFTGGEVLSDDIMTLRMQGDSGTLNRDSPTNTSREPIMDGAPPHVQTEPPSLEQIERDTLQRAITAAHGNLSAAARLLNTTRPKLAYRARRHGLIVETSRMK